MSVPSAIINNLTRARNCEARSDFEGAWSIVSEELGCLEKLTQREQAEVLLCAGTIASRGGFVPLESAKVWLNQALALFNQTSNSEDIARAHYGLALNCKLSALFHEAHVWLDSARKRTDDLELICRIELLRGIVFDEEGRSRDALNIFLCAAPLFETLDNDNLIAKFHGEIAIAKRQLAAAEHAPEYFDEALLEYTAAEFHHAKAEDPRSLAIVKNNTAYLLFKLGRYEEALRKVDEGIEIYTQLNDRQNKAQAKETRAQILLAAGRAEEAEAEAAESVVLLRIGGARGLLIESLITHGRCLARLSLHEKAANVFRMAEEVAKFIDFPQGLGLISLTILEELGELNVDGRRHHHKVVRDNLNAGLNSELSARHDACITITAEMFKAEMGQGDSEQQLFDEGFSLDEAVQAFERMWIEKALEEASGCQKEAARLLGVSASNLNFKLKNHHKAAKHLQTYGHYRGVRPLNHVDTKTMPNNALIDLGIQEGDVLVLKRGCRIAQGDVTLLRSRGKLYVGIYSREPGKVVLYPASDEYEAWELSEGTFEVVAKVVGFIPRADVGQPETGVRGLARAISVHLPAS